jgi:hypothetical protein
MFIVNPPLVRSLAMIPVALTQPSLDPFVRGPGQRPEFISGALLARSDFRLFSALLTLARRSCIPLAVIGGWICYIWARELWGEHGGLVALLLWVASPSIIAYGHLITPDLGSAALGILAAYALRRWLRRPGWESAISAGMALGLAELTKLTWIELAVAWPLLWASYRLLTPVRPACGEWFRQAAQTAVMLVVALWTINLGYGFEGSFRPLGEYQFISGALSGDNWRTNLKDGTPAGNRIQNSFLAALPVPLPENYVRGVDLIKSEYEAKYWSYLNGRWRLGGWWYYYLYAMLIKEPLGTWGLAVLAVAAAIVRRRKYASPLREELLLLVPAVGVIALVSSQTGFNHHLRYVLPAFPFLFILISRVGRSVELGHWKLATIAGLLLSWSIVSSLRVVPHSLGYFNELGGGPYGGHYHLGASNADWGQDLLYLADWYTAHTEARPFHLAYDLPLIDPKLAGIEAAEVPVGPHSAKADQHSAGELGPLPGWYAVSVNKIHNREKDYDYFLNFQPVGYAGYSMYIYHISLEQANTVRRKLGMAEVR